MSTREATRRAIRRGYVHTARGEVHLRHAGSGPPVVLLHDSPRSSRLHEPLLAALSDRFTLIALDTPGYGNSTPLQGNGGLRIADFADALAEAMAALGLSGCPVYGFHTSSKIALEFACRHPTQASLVIMEGLSLPAQPTPEAFIERYMTAFPALDDGSHLAQQWTKIRDMHRFFPWFDLRAETRMPVPLPPLPALHDYSLDLFSAGEHFSDAYAAAMRYPAQAALAALRTPAVFCARPSDVLYPYLEALPEPLPPQSRVERLPDDREGWIARLGELFAEGSATGGGDFRLPATSGHGVRRRYATVGERQLHLREHLPATPAARGEAVLLLHDLPGAGCELETLLQALGDLGCHVILPDLPGSGDSDPLPETADAGAYAAVLAAAAAQLGVGRLSVYADFGSSGLALRLARDWPALVHELWLEGVPWLDETARSEVVARIAPPLEPRGDGAHLQVLWHLLRDREMAWPWYDGSAAGIRGITPRVGAQRLQPVLLETLKQLPAYGRAARAAFAEDLGALLAALTTPVTLLETAGDRRSSGVAQAAGLAPHVQRRAAPADISARARLLAATPPAP